MVTVFSILVYMVIVLLGRLIGIEPTTPEMLVVTLATVIMLVIQETFDD